MNDLSSTIFPMSYRDLNNDNTLLTFSDICDITKENLAKSEDGSFWEENFSSNFEFNTASDAILRSYSDKWIDDADNQEHSSWKLFIRGLENVLPYELLMRFYQIKGKNIEKLYSLMKKETASGFSKIINLILKIERKSAEKLNLALFLSNKLLPSQYFNFHYCRSDLVYLCSSVSVKCGLLRPYESGWAILSPYNHLTIIQDAENRVIFDSVVDEITCKNGKVKAVVDKNKIEFKCLLQAASVLWENYKAHNAFLFDSFYSIAKGNYPQLFVMAFRSLFFSDDLILFQALFLLEIGKLDNWDAPLNAVITAAIDANRVDFILSYIIGNEVSQTKDSNLILRSNSICTHLFKQYYKKYGAGYLQRVITPLFDKILSMGIDNIKDPNVDIRAVEECVFSVIDDIIDSLDSIPLELRHVARSIYNSVYCLNGNANVILNALSSFFALRFLMSTFISPETIGRNDIPFAQIRNLIAPFGSIVLSVFSCTGVPNTFPNMKPFEEDFLRNKEKYFNFFMRLPLRSNEKVIYRKVSEKEIDDAYKLIIDTVVDHQKNFLENIIVLINDKNRIHPYSFQFENDLIACFKHEKI